MQHPELIGISRRQFAMAGISAGAALLASPQLFAESKSLSTETRPTDQPTSKPGTNSSFASIKQIDADLLNVGYAEAGPANSLANIYIGQLKAESDTTFPRKPPRPLPRRLSTSTAINQRWPRNSSTTNPTFKK